MADIDTQPTTDLAGGKAAEKIVEIADGMRSCMFTTAPTKFPPNVCPMALQKVEADGSTWFISSSESDKNSDIVRDPRVVVTFQNDSKSQYLSVAGHATLHKDKATIDKYWTSFANAWFQGKDDPRVTIICVRPTAGHYWDTQHGKTLAMVKMSFAALTGTQVDDGGIEGALKL